MILHQKHGIRLALILIATTLFFIANIQRAAIPGAIFDLLQSDFTIVLSFNQTSTKHL